MVCLGVKMVIVAATVLANFTNEKAGTLLFIHLYGHLQFPFFGLVEDSSLYICYSFFLSTAA